MKFLKIAVAASFALIAIALLVLWNGVDATGLGNTALAQLGIERGMDARIEGARFSLGDGLSLQGLHATASTESGEMEADIESLDVEVTWLPLLRGEVEIRSLTLESPRLSVVLREEAWEGTTKEPQEPTSADPGDPTEATGAPEPTGPAPLRIATVELHDAVVVVSVEGRPGALVTLEQFDTTLRDVTLDPSIVPPLLGATGSGDVTIGSAVVGSLNVDRASGHASLDKGRIEMTDLVARSPAGNLDVPRLFVDMTSAVSTFEAQVHADSVDLSLLAGYPEAQPFGAAAMTATFSGSTGGELTGDGVLNLASGGMPQSPSLLALDSLLGISLASARYDDTVIQATAIPGGIRVEPFELLSPALRVHGSGTLAGQNLDLILWIGVPRATVNTPSFSALMLDGLTDGGGWVNFPVHVGGTVLEPSYVVDMAAMKSSVESRARRSALDEAQKRIGRAIGGSICCRL